MSERSELMPAERAPATCCRADGDGVRGRSPRVVMSVLTTAPRTQQVRLPGPDVVRAVALIGVVVMNFHGYLILRGDARGTRHDRPVLRSVDRTAGDAVRRHVRARRRRRGDVAHPQLDR